MNTHFRSFNIIALRTMTGDALKDGVSDATSCFKRSLVTFYMSVGLYDGYQHCVGHQGCRNGN